MHSGKWLQNVFKSAYLTLFGSVVTPTSDLLTS